MVIPNGSVSTHSVLQLMRGYICSIYVHRWKRGYAQFGEHLQVKLIILQFYVLVVLIRILFFWPCHICKICFASSCLKYAYSCKPAYRWFIWCRIYVTGFTNNGISNGECCPVPCGTPYLAILLIFINSQIR